MQLFIIVLLTLFSIACTTEPTPHENKNQQPNKSDGAAISVSAEKIKGHMAFLADDLLQGRETGTRGYDLAALYVASRFQAIGLKPGGDDGSYLQNFRVRATQLVPGSVNFSIRSADEVKSFTNGEHVAIFGDALETDQSIEAPVVFAGAGIVAPEFGMDDYAGLDVENKIVAIIGGPPAYLPSEEAAHYGSISQQRKTAANLGAIGVLVIYSPALETRYPFARLKSLFGRTEINWIGKNGEINVDAPDMRARALLDREAALALFDDAPRTLDEVFAEAASAGPKGFPLKTIVSMSRRSTHFETTTANVAAVLPGADPKLADQFVVLTAHLDHVGVGAPVNGDSIYNGALDNAFGVAAMLEVARTLAESDSKPKRSVLFLAVGAEEKGLIGSDYFAEFPTVPIDSIIANINLDGALPFYDFSDLIAFGAEHSTMGARLKVAAASMGLKVGPDPFPEQGIFTRSDQYSFVKRGVPALFLYMGFTNTQGENVGRKLWDEVIAAHYHKPSDDLSLPIDYDVAAKFTEVFRRVTVETASHDDRPLWYEDSVFGDEFAPERQRAHRRAP